MNLPPRTALVADTLASLGGAEKVLFAALELFPDAPIYTLVYDPKVFADTPVARHRVLPSSLDRFHPARTQYRKYLPLLPALIEGLDLREYDLILSFSYAVAHGVVTRPEQLHLTYMYTPMRYAWRKIGLDGTSRSQKITDWLLAPFRSWDAAAAGRVHRFSTVSHWIASCIENCYRRQARVIYPPVDVERFHPRQDREDFYITISRLVPHKRLDLVVEAFSRLKLPLIVVGEGPEHQRLQRMAASNIQLIGYRSDRETADLLNRARAFISAGEEDFGITLVEAQAAGCPVIAYGKGGALETVLEDSTGLFFDQQTVESLINAVKYFEHNAGKFSIQAMTRNAQRFSRERFKTEMEAFIGQAWHSRNV